MEDNLKERKKGKISRRKFIENIAIGGALFLFEGIGMVSLSFGKDGTYSMIIVEYNKCAGCRTCETVCSAANHKIKIGGVDYPGLGNPNLSNIRVYSYNPDTFVPNVCQFCEDSPCVNACPSPIDKKTGKKALSKDEVLGNIIYNPSVCMHCGNCARACKEKSAGVIIFDEQERRPTGMCTLCGGDPQCVKYCPYGALHFVKGKVKRKFYKMKPDKIAEILAREWYKGKGGKVQ